MEDLQNNSTRNFTTGSTDAVIYYKNVNSSVPDSSIHWTTDTVETGDNKTYTNEYSNPVNLEMVFSKVGTGVVELTSFYRNSPATVIGAIKLAFKGIYLQFIKAYFYKPPNTFSTYKPGFAKDEFLMLKMTLTVPENYIR